MAERPAEEVNVPVSVADWAAACGKKPASAVELAATVTLSIKHLRDSCTRRDPAIKGMSVESIVGKLAQWLVQLRILELGDMGFVFEMLEHVYYLDQAAFAIRCDDVNVDLGAFAEHRTDFMVRSQLFDALWAVEWENLQADLRALPALEGDTPLVLLDTGASHPEGFGPGLEEVGQYRQSRDRYAVGLQVEKLSDATQASLTRLVFRITTVRGGADGPRWARLVEGMETTVLVSATLAGYKPDTPISDEIRIEGIELPYPHRRFNLTPLEIAAVPTVENVGEAWALHAVDPTQTFFFAKDLRISPEKASWPLTVADKDGTSMLSNDLLQGQKKPDFSELLAMAGSSENESKASRKIALAELFATSTNSAMANSVAGRKGRSHGTLGTILPGQLGPTVSLTTGGRVPKDADYHEKMQEAEGFKQPLSEMEGTEKSPCLHSHWCHLCNADAIATVAVGKVSKEDLERGIFEYDADIRAVIKSLPQGSTICTAVHILPAAEGKRSMHTAMRGMPPMEGVSQCQRQNCSKWLYGRPSVPIFACECGYTYGTPVVESQDATKPYKEKAKTQFDQEMRYNLLMMGDGDILFEKDHRAQIKQLADQRRALNDWRKSPFNFPSVGLEINASARVIAYLPIWQTSRDGKDGLCLLDGQPPTEDISRGLPKHSDATMEDILKAAEKEPFPTLNERTAPRIPEDGDQPGNQAMINYGIGCYERLLKGFAFCNKECHLKMVAVAVAAVKEEFLSFSRGRKWNWKMVFHALQCLLDDNSERYSQACAFPQINQLTHAEQKAGGIFTFLPTFANATMLRDIWQRQEEAQFGLAEVSVLSGFSGSALEKVLGKKKSAAPKESEKDDQKRETRRLQDRIKKLESENEEIKINRKTRTAKGKDEEEETQSGPRRNPPGVQGFQGICYNCGTKGHSADRCPEPKKTGREARKARGKARRKRKEVTWRDTAKAQPEEEEESEDPDSSSGSDEEEIEEDEKSAENSAAQKAKGGRPRRTHAGSALQEARHQLKKSDEPPVEFPQMSEEEWVELKRGELFGSASVASRKVLHGCLPCNADGQPYCPQFQVGECRENCPWAHQTRSLNQWECKWQLWFLLEGGHKDFDGKLPMSWILSLASEGQKQRLIELEGEPRRRLALHILQCRLSNLANATDEPLSYGKIQEGKTTVHKVVVWRGETDWIPASPSLMRTNEISRVMIGHPDALLSGLTYDVGQEITLPEGGGVVNNFCVVKAMASTLTHVTRLSSAVPEQAPDYVLAQQIVAATLKVPLKQVIKHPFSLLAELWFAVSKAEKEGLPDQVLALSDPQLLSNVHVCHITRCPDTGVLQVTLNCVHVNVSNSGQYDYTPENWRRLWQPENNKGLNFAAAAQSCPVVFTFTDGEDAEWRHCEGLKLDSSYTFNETVQKLAKLAKEGSARVTLMERGHIDKLEKQRRHQRAGSETELKGAARSLKELGKKLGLDKDGRVLEPLPDTALQPGEGFGGPEALRGLTSKRKKELPPSEPTLPADEETPKQKKARWTSERQQWASQLPGREQALKLPAKKHSKKRVLHYQDHYLPKLEDLQEQGRFKEGVHYAASFFTEWLLALDSV